MDRARQQKKKLEKHRFKISDTQAKAQIEIIIRAWLKLNQEEAKEWQVGINETRESLVRDTASSKQKTLRLGANLPYGLLKAIEKQFPDVFKDKKQFRWFMKTFPMFTVPKKI